MALTGCLLSALLCSSCGKEAATGKALEKSTGNEVTTSERLFNAEIEIRRAVKMNDSVAVRRVIFENPDLSLDKRYDDGYTLLTFAIKNKFAIIRNILLEKGASVELVCLNVDYPGFSPLMLAAHLGRTRAISDLLDKGARIDAQDETGDTALHKAIKNGYDEAARSLIRAGADLQIENDRLETPLETAQNLGRKDITELLQGLVNLEMGAPTIPVFRRIILDGDIINYRKFMSLYPAVMREYADINPLVLAVDSSNELSAFEIAHSLLMQKFPVDGPQDADTTPLIRAVTLKKMNFVELFLRHRPDLNKLDKGSRPALYYAIAENDEKLVELLVNNGAQAKFETRNRHGRKFTFKACKVADMKQRELTTAAEFSTNRRIQSHLGCRWTR